MNFTSGSVLTRTYSRFDHVLRSHETTNGTKNVIFQRVGAFTQGTTSTNSPNQDPAHIDYQVRKTTGLR